MIMKLSLFSLSAAVMVNTATAGHDVDYTDTVKLKTAANCAIIAKTGISTIADSGNIAPSPRVQLLALTWSWTVLERFRQPIRLPLPLN